MSLLSRPNGVDKMILFSSTTNNQYPTSYLRSLMLRLSVPVCFLGVPAQLSFVIWCLSRPVPPHAKTKDEACRTATLPKRGGSGAVVMLLCRSLSLSLLYDHLSVCERVFSSSLTRKVLPHSPPPLPPTPKGEPFDLRICGCGVQ